MGYRQYGCIVSIKEKRDGAEGKGWRMEFWLSKYLNIVNVKVMKLVAITMER